MVAVAFWGCAFLVVLLFAVFLRLSFKLLPIPALYMVLCWTILSSWDSANPKQSEAIFFALIGLNVLVWIVQIVRRIVRKRRERKREEYLAEALMEQAARALHNGKQNVRVNADGPTPFVEYD